MDSKKITVYSIILVFVTAIVTFILTMSLITSSAGFIASKGGGTNYTKLDNARKIIEAEYYLAPDKEKLADGAVAGLVDSLEDPYSVYMSKEEYDTFETMVTGEYSGIGVTIHSDPEDGRIVVVSPIEGTPAEKSGLKTGDKILKVDDEDVWGDKIDQAVVKMKGQASTSVKIDVLKADTNEIVSLVIVREKIVLKSVRSEMIDNIGYIRISSFEKDTGAAFKAELDIMKQQNAEALIVDLRSNPGGILDSAQKVADYLLPECNITYIEDREGKREYIKSDNEYYDIPMAVLINGGSASASEIFSGAMRDHKRAMLVGTKTFGKGLVQTTYPLNDGSYIKLTIARYFTPNGEDINKLGINPDYPVELPKLEDGKALEREDDTQLQKALELLKK